MESPQGKPNPVTITCITLIPSLQFQSAGDSVERDTQPGVWSPTWGCTVLINTGSTSTIIKENVVRNRGWQSQVKLHICVATTVAGPTPLSDELVLSLKGLSGKNQSVVAHVMAWILNEYDAILTDAFRCVKGVVRMKEFSGVLPLGTKRYLEGEPLSITRRVRHEIVNADYRVVYINLRRYPQALMDVIRQELKDFFDQGVIRRKPSRGAALRAYETDQSLSGAGYCLTGHSLQPRVCPTTTPILPRRTKNPWDTMESLFRRNRIRKSINKYDIMLPMLVADFLTQVTDILYNLCEEPYERLEERLITIYSVNQSQRIRKLLEEKRLGSQKPS
ncbi:hypothetical protein AAG570_011696 [Ranatra chinensis]|uniref:DUF7041 domain-containing protein n=1 Tax=Ranatra chinensis TaxID=642074 RepID=A0ABD0Z2V8_9HEMI